MTDYFAVLDEPRRPWIEPEQLKSKFLVRSGKVHPDRMHALEQEEQQAASRRFAELNAAFNTLKDPLKRVRHLLELQQVHRSSGAQEITSDLADLFIEIARLLREANSFLSEKAKASSPMLRVQRFERSQEWTERLREMQRQLEGRQDALLNELKHLDTDWTQAHESLASRERLLLGLDTIQRRLGFYVRWNAQLQEAIVQLAL